MNIDSKEFEEICHEILEKITNQSFRVFGLGPDGGIDIQSNENEKIIGQAKLYIHSTQSVTVSAVKREFERVKNKEIEQYYLFLGREMSPESIQEIYDYFKEYMDSKDNIYTLKEIDELLQKEEFLDIVRRHINLWSCSSNILELMLNKETLFDCEILLDNIQRELELFVKTETYDRCKAILEEKRNLLILGSPGIGKTTISKMLTLSFAQKGYTVRYTDARNLNELKKAISLDQTKKEFIFLDDCLGQSYLELQEEKENDLIRLIKYVKYNTNKILLLNSRVTVFQEAIMRKIDLEKSKQNEEFNIAVIDIEKMSNLEKARILERHLRVKQVPEEYRNAIRKNGNYMEIIKNANYSPRIIDYMTEKSGYSKIKPEQYVSKIIEAFKKSEYVWEDEFKYKIGKEDRILLYILYSISSHYVKENILKQAFLKRIENERIDTTKLRYEDILKRLNGSFIKIIIINEERYISASNPSVNDFLKSKLEDNKAEKEKMKASILVIEQCDRILEKEEEKIEFIKNKMQQGTFLQLLTNEYSSIEDLALAYATRCNCIEMMKISNIQEELEILNNSYTIFEQYLTKLDIIMAIYRNSKYTANIEAIFQDGRSIIYLAKGMDLLDQIQLLQLIFETTDNEKIKNKDSIVKHIEQEIQGEIRYFPSDQLEMDIGFDDIVKLEIEELKMQYEYDKRNIYLYEEDFMKELLQNVEKSFKWSCANYIDDSIGEFYNELPRYLFDHVDMFLAEDYINENLMKELAKKYVELVYDTPEQNYEYYKRYLYESNLLEQEEKEEWKIDQIFKQMEVTEK